MQRTRKVSEIINRGITAVAMTIAIAVIYSAMVTEGQISRGDVWRQQVQTVLKLQNPDMQITQDAEDTQESLATDALSTSSNTSSYR
ncbi:MAG: hypothetical protein F6K11_33110 [Leptolyngbya sp. SIO3F4]|nr:hypothetical protein [Leptolyngbya sp. SIO3F4]